MGNPEDQTSDEELRPVEAIRADHAKAAQLNDWSHVEPPGAAARRRIVGDVPSLLSRLAVVERENERLRNEITGWDAGARFVRAERDEARSQLADTQAQLVERQARIDWLTHVYGLENGKREAAAEARLEAVKTPGDLGELAAKQSMMISGSYPPDLSGEAHLWRRCAKAGEEHGEVIEALLGLVGENPRKGVTADREKVIKELLDEAFAALGAVEHLRGNDGSSGGLLVEHARFVTSRLAAALSVAPQPEPAVQVAHSTADLARVLAKHQLAYVLPGGVACTCGAELSALNPPLDDGAIKGEPLALAVHQLREIEAPQPEPDEPAKCEHDWDFMRTATTCRRCGSEYDPGPGPVSGAAPEEKR